jgi:hypothetical protein
MKSPIPNENPASSPHTSAVLNVFYLFAVEQILEERYLDLTPDYFPTMVHYAMLFGI